MAFDARVLERAIQSAIGLDNPCVSPPHPARARRRPHEKTAGADWEKLCSFRNFGDTCAWGIHRSQDLAIL